MSITNKNFKTARIVTMVKLDWVCRSSKSSMIIALIDPLAGETKFYLELNQI